MIHSWSIETEESINNNVEFVPATVDMAKAMIANEMANDCGLKKAHHTVDISKKDV